MYIGKAPVNGFHSKQQISGDGSETTFVLDYTVADETSLIVSVNAVLLEPKTGYNLSTGGTKIVFATAPASGHRSYIQFLGLATVQNILDLNGAEFFLDGDADTTITADTDDVIDIKIGGSDEIKMTATALSPATSDGNALGTAALEWADLFLADQDVTLTHVADTGILLNSTRKIQFGDSASFIHQSSNGVLTIDGEATIDLNASTAVLVSNDLKLNSDAAIIGLGADNDVTLTHVADTGILINSSRKIQFSDATQFIHGLSDTVLALGATDEIDLTATAIDINGTCDISGTFSLAGTALTTTAAEINLIDGGTSRGTTAVASGDGILINDGGTMRMTNVNTVSTYFSSHNVGGGNIVTTGALDTGSITSGFGAIDNGASAITTTGTGTIGNLVVDDVGINGKAITMTGSSGDTFTTTVGTNGATTLTTVDTAAAAANITIAADGTAELAGTTVTLNSSGGVTLDADGGTITFADAGSSLGTITSSGYSGTAAIATAVTVTDNESTNENNVITFVAGADADGGNVGLESDGNLTYNPSTGTLSATNLVVTGTQTITNSVTMNASNAVVFEGATADAHETTLTTVDATGDRTISLPNVSGTLPVLAAASATAITATPAELNYSDGVTSAIQTQFNTIIANNWVTTARINADAITNAKIADDQIDSEHYVDGSIDTAHIADGQITADKLGADSVTAAKIGDNVLNSEHYAAGSIDAEHLASDSVTEAKMAANSVDSQAYVDGSIDTAHIAALNVTGAKLALDRRSANATDDVKMGNQHDYIFADADVGLSFFTANAEDMRLLDDGTLHVDGDVVAFSSTISDKRLKHDIEPIENALEKVGQLNGCTFTYSSDGKKSAGLIAQDVEKVLPSAVTEKALPLTMDDGNTYKVLQYDQTIGLLVEAIKELTAKNKIALGLIKKLEEKK